MSYNDISLKWNELSPQHAIATFNSSKEYGVLEWNAFA